MRYVIIIVASICALALVGGLIGWLVTRDKGADTSDLVVATKVGSFRGLRDEDGFLKFLGVPYGKIGQNIFGVAEAYPAFDGIYEANDDSKICLQINGQSGVTTGSIDCLNINIYIPDKSTTNRLFPVMVWIHGGTFVEGSAVREATDPKSLLSHDVIVVSVNYRLGVFGFMCLDNPEVPGNTGLKDQVLALRWIINNIGAFRGDVNKITVFGESAGAMSANLHLFSLNEKLFDRAIIMSGPANSNWALMEPDRSIPIRISEALGYSTTDVNQALTFLLEKDAVDIAKVAYDLKITSASDTNMPLTRPCIEQVFEGVENFLTEHPLDIESIKISTIPVIMGYNNMELAFQYGLTEATFFDTFVFDSLIAMGFDVNSSMAGGIDTVRYFYIGDEDIDIDVRWNITNIASDFIFNHPTQKMMQQLIKSGATVFSYMYTYDGNNWFGIDKTWSGAAHSEILMYLFDLSVIGTKSSEDQLVIDNLTTLWTNFAKYGDPTPDTSQLLSVKWTSINETNLPYLEIDSELKRRSRPFHRRMAFWDLFYKKYGRYQKFNNAK